MAGIDVTPAQAEAFEHEWWYHLLPDGRGVAFSFCEATHLYRIKDPFDGHCFNVPSVTQILDRAGLRADFSKVPFDVLEHKRQIGSYTHKAAHLATRGELDATTVDPEVEPYLRAYLYFLRDSEFEIIHTERRVVGFWNGMWWAGTLDLEGNWQGRPWILDLKCSAGLHPGHEIQTAGYELTLPKPLAMPFRYERGTLHLKPDGTYAAPKRHLDPSDRETFLLALQLEWEKRKRGI